MNSLETVGKGGGVSRCIGHRCGLRWERIKLTLALILEIFTTHLLVHFLNNPLKQSSLYSFWNNPGIEILYNSHFVHTSTGPPIWKLYDQYKLKVFVPLGLALLFIVYSKVNMKCNKSICWLKPPEAPPWCKSTVLAHHIALPPVERRRNVYKSLRLEKNLGMSSSHVILQTTCSHKLSTAQRAFLGSRLLVLPPLREIRVFKMATAVMQLQQNGNPSF